MKPLVEKLEDNMVSYSDLKTVQVIENGETFTTVDKLGILYRYQTLSQDMQRFANGKMLIRKSVSGKLLSAQELLQKENYDLSLLVTYGYRTLEVQIDRFLEILKTTTKFFPNPTELYEEVHRFVAVPTVAGHPTGGAVDIIIIDKRTQSSLDFGGQQYDYSTKDCYVFSPNISKQAKKNRILLRSVMMKAGFAPFDGEWWHFSYGDREWAYYYKKKNAIYEQKLYKEI